MARVSPLFAEIALRVASMTLKPKNLNLWIPPRRLRWYSLGAVVVFISLLLPVRVGVAMGSSMRPTLDSGQLYLLRTGPLGATDIRRGDVIVFDHDGERYIKRVLALPGDHVPILKRSDSVAEELVTQAQLPMIERYLRDPLPRTMPFRLVERRVPPDHFYVIGDCMPASRDSRNFGPIPLESVRGKLLFTPPAPPGLSRIAGVQAAAGA
jgi:signal peptidase I